MRPRPTLEALDARLVSRSLQLDAIVVGGSALALLGVSERQTRDVDILHPELSAEVTLAAREFAAHLRGQGVDLADDRLNDGPMQLAEILPGDWRPRVRSTFEGAALRLTVSDAPICGRPPGSLGIGRELAVPNDAGAGSAVETTTEKREGPGDRLSPQPGFDDGARPHDARSRA